MPAGSRLDVPTPLSLRGVTQHRVPQGTRSNPPQSLVNLERIGGFPRHRFAEGERAALELDQVVGTAASAARIIRSRAHRRAFGAAIRGEDLGPRLVAGLTKLPKDTECSIGHEPTCFPRATPAPSPRPRVEHRTVLAWRTRLRESGTLCHNQIRVPEMLLDDLQREFEAVRSRARVIRGYL